MQLNPFPMIILPFVPGDSHLINQALEVRTTRDCYPLGTPGGLDLIAISPVVLGKFYVVIENKQISMTDER